MDSIANTMAAGNFAASNLTVASQLDVGAKLASGSPANFAERMEKLQSMDAEQAQKLGKEFESVFVSLLLKEMRNTLDQGEGGLFGSEQSDTFGGMFDQFMGTHLADSSPLGIAGAIEGYLKNKPMNF